MKTSLLAAAALLAVLAHAHADAAPALRIETLADGFGFQLVGDEGTAPWVLQHSRDGRSWQDVLFLERGKEAGSQPGVEVPKAILAAPEAPAGLFRAVRLAADEPLRRRFLAERAKWRLSGIDSYDYELQQNSGPISWRGRIRVVDGEVVSSETIEIYPPFFDPPDAPTIESLFARIASAIASGAETIDVTWHPVYGIPMTCFIDQSSEIADEEFSWTVDPFTPL